MNVIILFLLFLVVSIPAWCRRRNVGILTWVFRMIPLLMFIDPLLGFRFFGLAWVLSMVLFSLFKESLLLASAVLLLIPIICGMIVFWQGWRLKMPEKRWLRRILLVAYSCCSILVAAGFAVFAVAAVSAMFMSWQCRAIDRRYATTGEMAFGGFRPSAFAKWLPPSAKDIHYRSEAKFGQVEERLTCHCEEADLVRFAVEHSYPLATNSFIMLDYPIPEQGIPQYVQEQMEKDAETQQRLVFGERPLPARFISLTQSHAFDGGACGGEWRVILVLDRDTGEMSGYHWSCCL
jgi:hypothetical protein